MLAGLAPFWASTPQAPWPAAGPGPDVAELRRARSCLSTTFFVAVLRIIRFRSGSSC